jgi:hypothetical protein
MKEEDNIKWKKFEKLVANIQQSLAPGAKVIHNDKVLGKISKTPRQIDISIRQNVGQFNLFIAIECKDHKNLVDISSIEEFISKLKDIEANKGAIVSASGFTAAAKRTASESGIDLYRIIDTEKHDWQTYISIPVLCDFRGLKRTQFEFRSVIPGPCRIPTDDPKHLFLYRENGSVIDTVFNILVDRWNKGSLPNEPGIHNDIKLLEYPTSVKNEDTLYHLDVYANIEVIKQLYFGHVSVNDMKGFFDEQKGGVIIKSLKFGIDVNEIEKNWPLIKSEEDLAVKPAFTMMAQDNYPLIKIAGAR